MGNWKSNICSFTNPVNALITREMSDFRDSFWLMILMCKLAHEDFILRPKYLSSSFYWLQLLPTLVNSFFSPNGVGKPRKMEHISPSKDTQFYAFAPTVPQGLTVITYPFGVMLTVSGIGIVQFEKMIFWYGKQIFC